MNTNVPYVPATFGEHPNNPFFIPAPRPMPLDVDKTKKPIVVAKKSNNK